MREKFWNCERVNKRRGKKVTKNFFLAITNDTHVYNYFSCNGGEIHLIKFYCHDVDMVVENKERKRGEKEGKS